MTGIDLERVDDNPVRYWRAQQREIEAALGASDTKTRQYGSYAFVKAAKAGAVQDLSSSFVRLARNHVTAEDTDTRVNVIGGIGGTLIFADSETRRRLVDPSLVTELASAATTVEQDLSENALLTLSEVALEWPDLLVDTPVTIDTCVEKMAGSGKRATYAALSLANVAYHDPDAVAPYFRKFRMFIDPAVDERQLAALIYCLAQTVPQRTLDEGEVDAVMKAIDYCSQCLLEGTGSQALRTLVIESMAVLAQRWPRAILETPVTELVETVLSWGNSSGLSAGETTREDQTPLSVAEAAIKLAIALPKSAVDLDGQMLLAIEGATEDPEVEKAATKLRKNVGTLTVESVFERLVVEIEHLDEFISVDINNSRNINFNSPNASNVYYG
jgi:hypothetical protein